MRTAGIDTNNRLVLQFFPKDVEDRLTRIESEYANGKTDLESLNKTVFALRPKGSGWEFFVEEQQFRPALKETHEQE